MLLDSLNKQSLIHPPKWLISNCMYLTWMGSRAYGCEKPDSDYDTYGFAIPHKDSVFPHLQGYIPGFGKQPDKFEQWQESHIKYNDKEYDITVYGIVRYFQLLKEGNPNIAESIFTNSNLVIHSTNISNYLRENRKLFLHKGCYLKMIAYSYSQLNKIENKDKTGNRAESIKKWGYDVKFAMNLVRLALQAEMVLQEHDLDLMRNKDILKDIRAGNWKEEDIRSWFTEKERFLQKLYSESKIPYGPDEAKIKELLLICLEMHYGNLENCVVNVDRATTTLRKIKELVNDY